MPKKTNVEINGKSYAKVSAKIGQNADGSSKRKIFCSKSLKEATAKRDEFLQNLNSGLNVDFQQMPVSKLMYQWLFTVVKNELSANSFDRYESVFRNYILDSELANLKVYEIERMYLQCLYNDMASKKGYSHGQIFNLNKLLRMFFNFALHEGYILKNPCHRLVIPKTKDKAQEREEIDPFTPEETKQILQTATGTMKALFQLGLATGLRKGELLGLRVVNVCLDEGHVNVCQALKKVKLFDNEGGHERVTVLEDTKTKSGKRTVPIPSALTGSFKRHTISEKEKHLGLGILFDSDNLFFTSEVCTPLDGKNVLTAWKRLLKRANVRYRCFHNIRHTYATRLFEARVPLITISKLLGHANTNITANTYITVIPSEKENAAEELNYLFQ